MLRENNSCQPIEFLENYLVNTKNSVNFAYTDDSFVVSFGSNSYKSSSLVEALKLAVQHLEVVNNTHNLNTAIFNNSVIKKNGQLENEDSSQYSFQTSNSSQLKECSRKNPTVNFKDLQCFGTKSSLSIGIPNYTIVPSTIQEKPWFLNPKQFILFIFERHKIDFNYASTYFEIDSLDGTFIAAVQFTNNCIIKAKARSKKDAEKFALFSLLLELEELFGVDKLLEKSSVEKVLDECFQPILAKTSQSKLIQAYYMQVLKNDEIPLVSLKHYDHKWIASIEFSTRSSTHPTEIMQAESATKSTAYNNLLNILYDRISQSEPIASKQLESMTLQSTNDSLRKTHPNDNSSLTVSNEPKYQFQFDINLNEKFFSMVSLFLKNSHHYSQQFASFEDVAVIEDCLNFITETVEDEQIKKQQRNTSLSDNIKFEPADYPIRQYKDAILEAIDENQVVIINGTAGCGKTTQVPSYLLSQYAFHNIGAECNVLVCEPRRLAALTAAHRVAYEWHESVGKTVGYNVRFDKMLPQKHGSILYCTNGVLLRMLSQPQKLRDYYSHIILDEIHERTTEIDLLLLAVRRMLKENENLRVILMSGTVDTEIFANYFRYSSVKIIEVKEKIYPIESYPLEYYTSLLNDCKSFQDSYSRDFVEMELDGNDGNILQHELIPYDLIIYIIQQALHYSAYSGDILVFLPGWEHIKALLNSLSSFFASNSTIEVLPLHSMISQEEQNMVFTPTKKRKIILSTNIAESSITIPTVKVVIDTLKEKRLTYDHTTKMRVLKVDWISKASMNQRKGRVGRTSKGLYIALASEKRIMQFEKNKAPEMQVLCLNDICLRIKSIAHDWIGIGSGLQEILEDTISPPSPENILHAIQSLENIGALESGDESLTPLGFLLAKIPVDVHLGKALLLGCLFGCMDPILTAISILSSDSTIFVRKPAISGQEPKPTENFCMKWAFSAENSDIIMLISAFNEWLLIRNECSADEEKKYFLKYSISTSIIKKAFDIRVQLLRILTEESFLPQNIASGQNCSSSSSNDMNSDFINYEYFNRNSNSMSLVKGILMDIFSENIFIRRDSRNIHGKIPASNSHALIHPSSMHAKHTISYSSETKPTSDRQKNLIYSYERSQRSKHGLFVFNLSLMTPEHLLFFTNVEAIPGSIEGRAFFVCRNWYLFKGMRNEVECIFALKRIFDLICDDFYRMISKPFDFSDSPLLEEESCLVQWNCAEVKRGLLDEFVAVFKIFMEAV